MTALVNISCINGLLFRAILFKHNYQAERLKDLKVMREKQKFHIWLYKKPVQIKLFPLLPAPFYLLYSVSRGLTVWTSSKPPIPASWVLALPGMRNNAQFKIWLHRGEEGRRDTELNLGCLSLASTLFWCYHPD